MRYDTRAGRDNGGENGGGGGGGEREPVEVEVDENEEPPCASGNNNDNKNSSSNCRSGGSGSESASVAGSVAGGDKQRRHPPHAQPRGHLRATLCISSQVGCQMGCTFCATGTMGLKGNLTTGEILEQLVHARAVTRIRNIVFMVRARLRTTVCDTCIYVCVCAGHAGCAHPHECTASALVARTRARMQWPRTDSPPTALPTPGLSPLRLRGVCLLWQCSSQTNNPHHPVITQRTSHAAHTPAPLLCLTP